ncbi:MAG TPA: glycoside hydrolase family 47 protein [Bacteroidota bacterium]|nr:glycoside hydrolase family 47 protein [Bacteroidota bacterium]
MRDTGLSGKNIAIAVALLPVVLLGPSVARAQQTERARLAGEVRAEFLHTWHAYVTYAWGHDELKPLSRSYRDWYGEPFYMTAMDAMDAMILMGLKEEADSTREFIATHLSFDRDVYVKNFEFTIRFLGGLLSTYQMTGDTRLLRLARDLGNRLLPAFHSPTGMPYVNVNLKTGAVRGSVTNPAEVGTLLLEYGTLSRLTGDPVYYDAAKKALVRLYALKSPIGLVGESIDVDTGTWVVTDSHVSGCIDSYYEYLLKCWRLFGDEDCRAMWRSSVGPLNRYIADSTRGGLWYGHADMATGKRTATHFGSLDAFFPAVLALSGDLRRARELEESCLRMWVRYGIEPEEIDYSTMTATDSGYALRPEIIESAYYLYHYTGDERYLRMGKVFFDSLRTYCRTDAGYAVLSSVISKKKADSMESFFLAETLKYLYLLFAPPETLDFDAVTLNTEAHPLRRTW